MARSALSVLEGIFSHATPDYVDDFIGIACRSREDESDSAPFGTVERASAAEFDTRVRP